MKNVNHETADRLFHRFDTSGDNRVSLAEFRAMLDLGDSHAKEKCLKCPESSKRKNSKSSKEPKMLLEAKGTGNTPNPIDTRKTKNSDFEVWGPKVDTDFFEPFKKKPGSLRGRKLIKSKCKSKEAKTTKNENFCVSFFH